MGGAGSAFAGARGLVRPARIRGTGPGGAGEAPEEGVTGTFEFSHRAMDKGPKSPELARSFANLCLRRPPAPRLGPERDRPGPPRRSPYSGSWTSPRASSSNVLSDWVTSSASETAKIPHPELRLRVLFLTVTRLLDSSKMAAAWREASQHQEPEPAPSMVTPSNTFSSLADSK